MSVRGFIVFTAPLAILAALIALGFARGRRLTDATVATLPGHYFVENVRFVPLGAGSRPSWPAWRLTYAARDHPAGRRLPLSFSLTGRPLYEVRYGITSHPTVLPAEVLGETDLPALNP
jgi:hypothetical protein